MNLRKRRKQLAARRKGRTGFDWLCRRYFEAIRRNRAQTWSAIADGVIGRHESVRFLHSEGL